MNALLRGTDLHRSYGPTPALRGIDVEVGAGEIVAVTGPSGCGKSTLLHCLAGILRIDSGEVCYRDQDIGLLSEAARSRLRRTDFGVLFQFGQLVPELTAAENVALPLLLAGSGRREARRAATLWLGRFGVGDLADKLPGTMSGGQQQRCAVARALVTEPRVLFADEPTGALDVFTGEQVLTEIVHVVREQGTAVVLVTHEPQIAAYADREIVLRDGVPTVSIVVVLLAVPLLAGLIGALLLRQVVISPLGVVRRTRERGPWPWPGAVIIAGPILFALPEHLDDTNPNMNLVITLLSCGVVLTMLGVVLGTGWISYTTGRLLRRFGPRPSMLLAGRRLMADPWNGSRTLAALLASVVAGAIALGYRAQVMTQFDAYEQYNASAQKGSGVAGAAEPEGFYIGAVDLIMVAVGVGVAVAAAGVLIALAESIVARRRAYAALTAVGVPVRTLSLAVLWQTLLPLLPALPLALASGITIARIMGTEVTVGGSDGGMICEAACQAGTEPPIAMPAIEPMLTMAVPVPVDLLALLGGGAFLAMLAAAGVGLLVLRSSTELDELRVG